MYIDPAGDTKKKLTNGDNLIKYLENQDNPIDCEDIGAFIDGLIPWMQSSNFKVSQNGLEVTCFMIDRLGSDFRPYLTTVLPTVVDRLGDNKEVVREKANIALCKLMDSTVQPQPLFEKMMNAFTHKNGKVREEILLLLQNTLNAHGASSLTVSKFIPSIVTLVGDPQSIVRDTALATLVEVYRHVGEKLRVDLQRRGTLPANKVSLVMSKFDDMRASGNMMPTAALGTGAGMDEVDEAPKKNGGSLKSRSSSVPASQRKTFATPKPSSGSGQAGAVDADSFIQAFEDVKKVNIYSGKCVEDEMRKIHTVLSNEKADWRQRMDSLATLRSVIIAGGAGYDEFVQPLKTLEMPMESCVKDLRSQVVREACITIAFMSQQLKHKVDRFVEFMLPGLINLIQNSAKVMATSGVVCLRFLIQNTYSSRFLPILCHSISSKSNVIRRHICEFMDQLLHTWPTQAMEKHVSLIQETIKKGISDADSEARSHSRKAYWGFADHFKEHADQLLNTLDPTHRRMLQGEMSNSSSTNSLTTLSGMTGLSLNSRARSRQSSVTGSKEDLDSGISSHGHRYSSATLDRKPSSGIPKWSSPSKPETPKPDIMARSTLVRQPSLSGSPRHSPAGRSNSAIDSTAARRASVRQQYSARGRMGMLPSGSLSRPRKSSEAGPGLPVSTPDRNGRRSKVGTVSQSQPGSRSASPSSLKSYQTYFDGSNSHGYGTVGRSAGLSGRRRSGMRSTGTSREPSPQRFTSTLGRDGLPRPTPSGGARLPVKPLMTEKILRQSREAETALADALEYSRKRSTGSADILDTSDKSETSSLCSEKSFEYGRRPCDGISDIIANCASTHWADRKDGLIGLQAYFREGRLLSATELRRVTEIFTKMFMDAHTKVFALFLETLCELVTSHKADLQDWLYVLLTKLISKLGADLLGSVVHKIHRTLDVIRESFSYEDQLTVIFKYMTDTIQTPNSKVKLAIIAYLRSLVTLVESADIPGGKEAELALAKLISWTAEPKSAEIRRESSLVISCMFQAHAPQMQNLLSKLPDTYQDKADHLINNQFSSHHFSPLKPAGESNNTSTPMKPRNIQSKVSRDSLGRTPPSSAESRKQPAYRGADGHDENMHPDDVNKSLRLTANAISNYSFDQIDNNKAHTTSEGMHLNDDRDWFSNSNAADTNSLVLDIDEKLAALEVENHMLNAALPPFVRTGSVRQPVVMDDMLYGRSEDSNGQSSSGSKDDNKGAIQDIVNTLQAVKSKSQTSERKSRMSQLIKIVRSGSVGGLHAQFRSLLRVLLENLEDEDGSVRALVFGVLTEMLNQESLQSGFHGFTELVMLKVLQAHKDAEKDVVRAAESCAATMAATLPPDMVVRVLNPIIKTGDFPVNQAAIKMLTKLVEKQNPENMSVHLQEIMPGLVKAYDNVESSVRKAAVFCIVALHQLVGEVVLKPHLETLNGSKMKLLYLYIKRANEKSAPSSQRTTPT